MSAASSSATARSTDACRARALLRRCSRAAQTHGRSTQRARCQLGTCGRGGPLTSSSNLQEKAQCKTLLCARAMGPARKRSEVIRSAWRGERTWLCDAIMSSQPCGITPPRTSSTHLPTSRMLHQIRACPQGRCVHLRACPQVWMHQGGRDTAVTLQVPTALATSYNAGRHMAGESGACCHCS